MALVVLRPQPSSRRRTGAPQPAPAAALPPAMLRAVPHRLTPPPVLRVAGRAPHRRELKRAPVIRLPAPPLRLPPPQAPAQAPQPLVVPAAYLPPTVLAAVLGAPAPVLTPQPKWPAIWVGITGGHGTVVSAAPADLTVGPVSDITNFRVSIDSGVW